MRMYVLRFKKEFELALITSARSLSIPLHNTSKTPPRPQMAR
jgi:hypothetical protein